MSGHTPLPATPLDLPLLPLRDVVVFPHMVIPLFVGRPKSIKALELAMEADRRIMLVAQKAAAKDEPSVSICLMSAVSPPSCRCSSCPMAPSRCWSKASSAPWSPP
jgi:ATP-dependent Lon protease